MKITHRILLASIAAFGLVALTMPGCSDSTTNNPTPPAKPGVGSSFVFYQYSLDSAGVKIPGKDDTVTAVVTATGMTYQGKTDVTQVIETQMSDNSKDTAYIHVEASNDIAFLEGTGGTIFDWQVYPTSSGGTINLPAIDTTVTDATGTSRTVLGGKIESKGTETIVVGSETLTTNKVAISTQLSVTSGTMILIDQHVIGTSWFAPKIGYLAKSESQSTGVIWGLPINGGTVKTLVRYTIK